MKPISLCLVQMGKTGLELVSVFPDVLPSDLLNKLVYKCMPMGANHGDFTSSTAENVNFSSYAFKLPNTEGRDNIATLVAVFSSDGYNADLIKRVFSVTIYELETKQLLNGEVLKKIMPNLYKGFKKGKAVIEVSSTATIRFNFEEKENEDKNGDALDSLAGDLW